MECRSLLSSLSLFALLISHPKAPLMALPSYLRARLLDRAEELGLSSSGLPLLLEELARWLPSPTIEAFLSDLEELSSADL